jgi:diguanylate cyclase (GGDEF)-like protein/PAS domain S-box-containing protein
MIRISPTLRITIGLVLIMLSILLLGDMLGLVPDRTSAIIEGRKTLAESLAVQYSVAAQKHDTASIKASMRILVERNDDVLSAALRTADGRLLAMAGDHAENWHGITGDQSSATHAQVPIYQGNRKWGTVEVSFRPLHRTGMLGLTVSPTINMIVFITITGFVTFLFFIHKTHQNIDPASVVPARVKTALDSLAEGVLLLDKQGCIILSNQAFAEYVGKEPDALTGKVASSLAWRFTNNYEDEFPWEASMRLGEPQTGRQLHLSSQNGETRTLMVNSVPVKDSDGVNRGVMATFDDVTQIEEKNDQLEDMLDMLKKSRNEIRRQNRELQVLATRDPLTDCLNRRSFFEKYEAVFMAARHDALPLACIMVDIDLFKIINDRYGHAKGDEVIRSIATNLQSSLRSTDTICRYGGEEFCIVLPGMELEQAVMTAERARERIEKQTLTGLTEDSSLQITASFGVTAIDHGADSLTQFIDQADRALYVSKNRGRNCVTAWDSDMEGRMSVDQVSFLPGVATGSDSRYRQPDSAHTVGSPQGGMLSATAPDSGLHPEHDSLTGLPNRRLFHDKIVEAIEYCRSRRQYFCVMTLDLDMFKRINNALGYTVGDNLLKEVSHRLIDTLRSTDAITRYDGEEPSPSIYRLGGDEFGILLTGLEYTEFISHIVNRIIESLTRQIDIDEHEIHLTCSVGISMYPDNGVDADTLLKNSGVALYYAKCHGHNSYQFYDEELARSSIEDLRLENDLRHAIGNNELELHYQPKVDLHSGRIISMEALVRWRHHDMGMVPPVQFIPIAESSGLIKTIGNWVLHEACLQIRRWHDAGFEDICIAVNLSAIQFRQADLLYQISSVLDDTGVEPQFLELEITESTIMEDIDAASETMRILYKAGVRISIDDFGTGYSSLNHLKRFPISMVKIDRSFVRDITTDTDDAAIIRAIVAMAHSMNLRVIAEGVETEAQVAFLRELQCDEMQGYLVSPPITRVEAETLLMRDRHSGSGAREVRAAS